MLLIFIDDSLKTGDGTERPSKTIAQEVHHHSEQKGEIRAEREPRAAILQPKVELRPM